MMCLIHTLHIHPLKGALHNIRYGIVSILRDLGNTFISYLSALRREFIYEEVFRVPYQNKSFLEVEGLDNDVLFGIFVVLAIGIEFFNRQTDSRREDIRSLYIDGLRKSPSQFYQLLLARFKEPKGRIQTILDKYGFMTEQQEFILRWIRKEINLVD